MATAYAQNYRIQDYDYFESPLQMPRKEIITRARGALPLDRERHRKTMSFGRCGSDGLAHQSPRNIGY